MKEILKRKMFNGGFVQGNPMFTNPFEDPFDDVLHSGS